MKDVPTRPRFIIRSAAELGEAVRYMRRREQFSIAEVAPLVNLGERFISEVERGKETAALGKVLQLLDGVGLSVIVVPKPLGMKLEHQLSRGVGGLPETR